MHLYRKNKSNYLALYNKIVSLTRKTFFYDNLKLGDSFETRVYLVFFHISLIFIILNNKNFSKKISQEIFDFFFIQIENDLRELGYGDTKINTEMKKLVKIFYEILLISEKLKDPFDEKVQFSFSNYLSIDSINKINNEKLINYFNKFAIFMQDIPLKSVIKGVFTFNYEDK